MNTRFIELAGEVNTAMPAFVVAQGGRRAQRRRQAGQAGARCAILGMAYKKDVDDPRESPGFELMDLLLKKGAAVTYNDPHIPDAAADAALAAPRADDELAAHRRSTSPRRTAC